MGVLDSINWFVTDLLGSQQAQGGKPSGGGSDIFYDDPTKRIPGVNAQQAQGGVIPPTTETPQVDAVVAEGVIDPANIPQGNQYRPMFNQGGGAVSGGGGAIMATDRGGRYTAQGKDLGYEPLAQTGGKPMDEKLYTQLLLSANEPITNQDYYPEQNNIYKGRVSIDGMSAPIFAGSMGVTPMGAIDKLRRRDTLKQAMSKLMEDTQDAQLEFVPPDIRQAALVPVTATQFEAQANGLTQYLQSKYGKEWVKKAPQDPETWRFVNNWKATEKAFNQGYDRAAEIIKLNNENQQKGNKMYLSDETLDTAKWLMTGVNENAQGLPVDIGELALMANRLEVLTNFDTWANEVLKNDKIMSQYTQQIPTAVEYQLQKDPTGGLDQEFQNQQKTLGAFPGGYRAYLMNKSIKQISEETAKESIETFDRSNPGAWKQMRNSESESKASVLSRMQSNFQRKLGTIMDAEVKTYTPPSRTTVTAGGGGRTDKTFYQSINERKSEIMDQAMNAKPSNVAQAKQQIEQIYGGGTADDLIYGVRAFDWPTINQTIASMPYSELYEPNASDFATKKEVYFGKVNKSNAGIPSETTTAKNLKVQGVVNGFIRKDKDGNIGVYSNEDAVRSPLTADYKPYLIQVVTDEKYESSGSDVDVNDAEAIFERAQKNKKSPATSGIYYRFIPLDKSTATTFDKVADKSGQFTGGTEPVSVEVSEQGVENF